MTDLNKVANPYDFANPVSDSSLFFGRRAEMDEIRYYLDLAKTAPRPINIALLGPRASGKTSILNMTQNEAEKRGFCVVRVNLDEGDARTQLHFFHKLFANLVFRACELGAFGGLDGKTYDTFLEIISTFRIPEEREFTPFLFPIQFAKAMSVGNESVTVLDSSYGRDLATVRDVLKRPIAILFDECNVLASSRVHLEKLRNIFMNLPGFMLVITGTPDLFPVIDEVFSPMVRQFKKIPVPQFKEADSRACVLEPLRKIGLSETRLARLVSLSSVGEIHDLSGGRPYEIQLICHSLFRRVQEKRANTMSLDVGVLDEVRRELETSQSLVARPILEKVRALDEDGLRALRWFLVGDRRATFDQLWAIEYLVDGERTWTRERLALLLDGLVSNGILEIGDEAVRFCGDDFEKIYIRLWCKEKRVRGVHGFDLELPPSALAEFRLLFALRRLNTRGLPTGGIQSADIRVEQIAASFASSQDGDDPFVEDPMIAEELYFLMFEHQEFTSMSYVSVGLNSPWYRAGVTFLGPKEDVQDTVNGMQSLRGRAATVAMELTNKVGMFSVVASDGLSLKLKNTANERARRSVLYRHADIMVDAYLSEGDPATALRHAMQIAACAEGELPPSMHNNVGYVLLAGGKLEQAESLFKKAIDGYMAEENRDEARTILPKYNLAVTAIRKGRISVATELLRECFAQCQRMDSEELHAECLFVPVPADGSFRLEETRASEDTKVDLSTTVRETLSRMDHSLT